MLERVELISARRSPGSAEGGGRHPVREWEDAMLLLATHLQDNVHVILTALDMAPVRWEIIRYDGNGSFQARCEDERGRSGPLYGGWAAVPDAIPGLLRAWSVPAHRAVDIVWGCDRPTTPPCCCPTVAGCPNIATTIPATGTVPSTGSAGCGPIISNGIRPGLPPT